MQIKLKGTREKLYFDRGSYRIIEKLAIRENKSIEDIVHEAYKDTFMYMGIQMREAMEDFTNAIKSEFALIINKAEYEFIKIRRHINWLNFKREITNWFRRVFNWKKQKNT
jgi:tRNA U34 5-carboxymethylaminomethyl modifying GTPase MnmE/TrmE